MVEAQRAAEQRLGESEAGGEREREQEERGADETEQQPLERQQRRQRAQRAALLAVQPALGDRHQHRVQDGDGEQAVGEHRQQEMQAEFERGHVGAADAAGKQQRQRQRQRGERERRRLQRVQVVDEALQPVEQHREPEHRRERVGEAEAQLLAREQLGVEQRAVQHER